MFVLIPLYLALFGVISALSGADVETTRRPEPTPVAIRHEVRPTYYRVQRAPVFYPHYRVQRVVYFTR